MRFDTQLIKDNTGIMSHSLLLCWPAAAEPAWDGDQNDDEGDQQRTFWVWFTGDGCQDRHQDRHIYSRCTVGLLARLLHLFLSTVDFYIIVRWVKKFHFPLHRSLICDWIEDAMIQKVSSSEYMCIQ